MPKRTAITVTLDPECYEHADHQVLLSDLQVARVLDRLNMAMSDLANELNVELRFDIRWSSTIQWALDRPTDHPPATAEEDVA